MKEKINKKILISLIMVAVLALGSLGGWLIWKNHQQPVAPGTVQEETDDAPVLVLDYNNVSLGLDHSFTVQAKTYFRGEEVKDKIEYTWELDEECSADIASMETANDSAKITGLAYGETAFKVSAEYKGTILVKTLKVHVSNIDVIFDSPNMELSAGCYTVNLWLLETETNITSLTPEIYVYDKEELVENPTFTWTNSDESIAVRDENGTITAKKAGSTLIVGTYKESELHIRVNVHRTKLEKDPVCIEEVKNFALSFSELRGMEVEDVRFNGESVLKDYNKGSGTIQFDPDKLPEIGTVGELVIQTDKAEMYMEAIVVTMGIHNESDLNKMASVIKANNGAGYYALAKDIRCSGIYDANLDVEFVGTFDGRGNAIYNMTTSDREGSNRGLLGNSLGATGVVKNVAFVNAKHSGNGGFIATNGAGAIKNVYIQIDIEYSEAKVTSILATYTFGVFSTENVLVEYMNPLPTDAKSGYALGQLYHGYAKHQGLYVIGADKVAGQIEDLGGGLKDEFAAYMSYGDFLNAGVDASKWENDFWSVQNGIPYPVKLGTRVGTTPNVSIPEFISPGSTITIQGATIYDRIVMSSSLKSLGIKVSGDQLIVPETVPAGTVITLRVSSVFDASKKTTITTKVLETERITLPDIYNAERYKQTTFGIDFGSYASKVEGAELFYVAADGKPFERMYYKNGILTLDTESPEGLGRKKLEVTFKKGDKLIAFTATIDVCTKAIYDEIDLKDMAAIITELDGAGRYVLGDDIVCTGTYDSNIGVPFTGSFDGHGFAIYDMTTSDRDAGNRGLLGSSLADTAVVENVSFVNAKHSGHGGLIALESAGTIRNVYIQVDVEYNPAKLTSVLATYTFGGTTTENVLIEYMNPLPTSATSGHALGSLYHGYAKHQGFYVIGANKVAGQIEDLGGGLKDDFAAYMSYGDYLDAGENASAWENEFWDVYNGIPYPKHLGSRAGEAPKVSIPKYLGIGGSVVIDGLTMHDRVILGADMKALGITVKDGALHIPASVPRGTNVKLTVESVFDSSKKTVLQAPAYATINITLENTYDVETYNRITFDIDFGTQADAVDGGTIVSATVDNKNFAKATYQGGVLTLDTSTLADFGEKVLTVVFNKDNRLVTVTINIDVSTMVIRSEEDLNNMASVIGANNGEGRYVLGQDITCHGTYDANLNTTFNGTFDGRGYAIHNMATTTERDGDNRGLLGLFLGPNGVVENVSFVNAKHCGQGGFIASKAQGKIRNVYIQIDITGYNANGYQWATSVLASETFSEFSTEKVFVEYINPLPTDATNGYALWRLYGGYAKHQGLYVVGEDQLYNVMEDLGGGQEDIYAAYRNYGDFLAAENDLTTWANDFWTVTNGIPYPTKLGTREAVTPNVQIPAVAAPGSDIVITGVTMFDRIILDADAKALGITVSNNVILVPETVPAGTTVNLVVQSAFDETKKVNLSTEILTSKNVSLEEVTIAEIYNNTTFQVDLTQLVAEIGEATLVSAAVDGRAFVDASYANGILTLDTVSLAEYGQRSVSATFKGAGSLVSVTLPIDVCTLAIDSEAKLNSMASVIALKNGEGRYILTKDITCQGTYDANLNTTFNGTFDGRGYAIHNMATTTDRDGDNRGLLGLYLGPNGVLENVSFVNAKHSGQGGFIASKAQGKIRNVYVQIDITGYNANGYQWATSVLASEAFADFSTDKVFVEYIKPLPTDATNGYALWRLYYGYAKHQGLYVVGEDRLYNEIQDLGGGQTDIYAAYSNYDGFLAAGNDLAAWSNDFWTVTNGIPYPTKLGTREAVVPEVAIPEIVEPGSNVVIEGVKVYERIVLDAEAQALGITLAGNVVSVPDTVALGTEVHLTVVSIFDTSKSTALTTTVNVQQEEEELKEITWTDFKLWNPLTFGTTFTSEACATYSGTNLNNTAFEGDVSIPSGSGFRYAVPSAWYGLTIKESSGKLLIGGDSYVAVNGKNDTAYTLNAADYGLTTFTGKRFTIRIELYNLSSDNLSANLNIYVNGKAVGEGITLTGSTVAATTYLGSGIGFVQNGLAGGITIYEAMPALTPITWTDFKLWNPLTFGTTFSSEACATYSGTSLNNTAFEGDVSIPAGSGFRYAVPSAWYGLTIKESSGKLLIGGDPYVAVNGVNDTVYTLNPSDYGLTTFTGERFTIRIELYNLSSDNLSATLNIYVNGKAVGEGITLTGSTVAATTYLGSGIGFVQNGLAGGITIYEAMPALTPITWTDFKLWDPLTFGTTFSSEACATYSGTNLNNTAFEGDVSIPAGSGFRYAVPSAWYGLTIKESSGKLLIGGDPYVAVNGVNDTVYTLNPSDYGLTTFTGERFTIRIELYNLSSDNLSATLNIYVNGKAVGAGITLTGSTAAATTYLGSGIGFVQNGLAGGITIYEAMPALTPITWTDFKLWDPLTFGTTFTSEACATYSGTNLNNTAFEGDVSIPAGSGFRYAVPSAWFGFTIKESSGQLLIGGDSLVALNGVNGTAYTLNAADYGLTTFTGERFTIRIELYNLSDDNLSANVNIYVNNNLVGRGVTLTGSTVAATTYLGSGIGFVQNGLAGGTTIYDVE